MRFRAEDTVFTVTESGSWAKRMGDLPCVLTHIPTGLQYRARLEVVLGGQPTASEEDDFEQWVKTIEEAP